MGSVGEKESLVDLFEADLAYRGDMEPVVSPEGRRGALIGSGDGVLSGQRIRGRVRWSFYSGDCAYLWVKAGVTPPPEQHLCTADPGGIIETEDGAVIRFDARGYGFRGVDAERPRLWRMAMTLQFSTEDERYSWLNNTFGVWFGEFDERIGRAHYRAYLTNGASGLPERK
ncbi:MAG: DUF3237 family protein [Candidatus Methylomirabilales bacterium]